MSDPTARKLSVGVIGLGYWGPNLLRNFHEHAGFEVSWICDLRPDRVASLRQKYPSARTTINPIDLFSDTKLDAIAIATPAETHFEHAYKALQAHKHVLLEKPMTRTASEGEILVKLAAKTQRVLMVDHTFLFTPAVNEIRRQVDSGELGPLYFVDGVRINLGIFQHDVNVIWDLAPHDLAIVLSLLGRMPKKVSAVGAFHTDSNLVDVAHLYLDFSDNLIAHFHLSWLSPVKVRQMVFGGARRTIVYNDNEPSEKIRIYEPGVDVIKDDEGKREVLTSQRLGDVRVPNLGNREALATEIDHFHRCILGKDRCISDGNFGLKIVKILEASDVSLKNGHAVSL
jgi:predicted dehydrogenase